MRPEEEQCSSLPRKENAVEFNSGYPDMTRRKNYSLPVAALKEPSRTSTAFTPTSPVIRSGR
jgi:hypothetical protein